MAPGINPYRGQFNPEPPNQAIVAYRIGENAAGTIILFSCRIRPGAPEGQLEVPEDDLRTSSRWFRSL